MWAALKRLWRKDSGGVWTNPQYQTSRWAEAMTKPLFLIGFSMN
jgi:hypothetical protein